MGAVSVDIHKAEREYKDFTLSDYGVVKYLLLYRYKLDISNNASFNLNINQAGDILEFNEEIICMYASLDRLVRNIELREKDRRFLKLIFEGNTVPDIIEIYKEFPKKTAYRILDKIIKKIIAENLNEWRVCFENQGYLLNESKSNK